MDVNEIKSKYIVPAVANCLYAVGKIPNYLPNVTSKQVRKSGVVMSVVGAAIAVGSAIYDQNKANKHMDT